MLSDLESKNLIQEKKSFSDADPIIIKGNKAIKMEKHLKSKVSQNEFILNIDRGKIELSKIKYQSRHKQTNCILSRIDTSGPRHQNPDGEFIECPHIHIYKEGYNDKWAYPLDENKFRDTSDLCQLLNDFLLFFNVEDIPRILVEQSFL